MITAISRGISFVGVSLKNIIYFFLFIGVILFLFFIPEILKYDWSSLTGFSFKSAAVVKEAVVPVTSPLDDVIQRINSGYYTAQKAAVKPAVVTDVQPKPVLPPFNPDVRIKKLEIIKVNPPLRRGSRTRSLPRTNIKILATLKGADIKRAELLHNGSYVRSIQIDRPDRDGRREFLISKPDAYGTWTIHLEDKNKRVYEKTYRFFPRIESFSRDNEIYQVRHTVRGLDPKIEKLFTVRETIPGRENTKGFVEF